MNLDFTEKSYSAYCRILFRNYNKNFNKIWQKMKGREWYAKIEKNDLERKVFIILILKKLLLHIVSTKPALYNCFVTFARNEFV